MTPFICFTTALLPSWQCMAYLQQQQVPASHQQGQTNGTGGVEMKLKFLQYAQSNRCTHPSDSSVSYAAAALTIHWYILH